LKAHQAWEVAREMTDIDEQRLARLLDPAALTRGDGETTSVRAREWRAHLPFQRERVSLERAADRRPRRG